MDENYEFHFVNMLSSETIDTFFDVAPPGPQLAPHGPPKGPPIFLFVGKIDPNLKS